VPTGDLERAIRPFGESTMLPAAAYTAPDVLAWELRHLFAGTWSCLGRLDELLGETTQRAVLAGDIPVLLTRDGETVAALANTCRHRGHELLGEGGTSHRSVVVCPYHAWTYKLDGTLRTAPRYHEVPADHGLVSLPVEVWHGWVFVNGTGDAAPFAEHVGALAELVAPYAPEKLGLAARHEYVVRANWKVVVENYHECYHCPHIHPELCAVSPPNSGDNYDLPGAWVGGAMDLRAGAETMSLDGRSRGAFLPGVDRRRVLYLALFPDLLLSLHPDYVMTHRLRPEAPGRDADRVLLARARRCRARRGVLGPHQPAGLGRLRVRAARARLAALPAGPVRAQRGRRAPVGDAARPRLPGQTPVAVIVGGSG
jgi:Rieske 2Fe-2S family protein